MDPQLVITNSGAGTADDEAINEALAIMREHSSVEVAATSGPDELDSVLHRAGSRQITVAGGDGSLHAVVAALYKRGELSGRTLALLPLGTGNDFARTAGIPLDICDAARLAVTGEARPVDLLVDELGGITVNNVHVGAGAQAARRGARWKERLGSIGYKKVNLGKIGYPIGALQSAIAPPYLRLHVEVDGEAVTDVGEKVLMVAIGNGRSVGGGTELTPRADPEDGRLDVMIARPTTMAEKLGWARALSKSEHHLREDVTYLRGRQVRISGEEFYISADGEIAGPETQRSWRLEPAAYSMVLPRPGEEAVA